MGKRNESLWLGQLLYAISQYYMIEPEPRSDNGLMTKAILFREALISKPGDSKWQDGLWLCLARVSLSRSSVLLSPLHHSIQSA